MKNFILFLNVAFVALASHAQLNISPSEKKCILKEELTLTKEGLMVGEYPTELQMKVVYHITQPPPIGRYLNASSNATVGANNLKLHFYTENLGLHYNDIYYASANTLSDSTIKKDIIPITNSIEFVKRLKGYSYTFKHSEEEDDDFVPKKSFGFLSQEVEQFLPEIVEESMGLKLMNYSAIIPFVAEATKEQQFVIERMESQITSLQIQTQILQEQLQMLISQIGTLQTTVYSQEQEIISLKEAATGNSQQNISTQNSNTTAILFQNVPNPFHSDTKIEYEIPTDSYSAKLIITDMQGVEIKTYNIIQKGRGNTVINGSELKAGLYLYTLLVDGNIVDVKQMVLTK